MMPNHSPLQDEDSQSWTQPPVDANASHLAAIKAVTAAVACSTDLDEILQIALEAVVNAVGVDAAAISLLDRAAHAFALRAVFSPNAHADPARFLLDEDLLHRAADEDQVVTGADDRTDGVQATAPMHAGGRVNGALSAVGSGACPFSDEALDLLQIIADQAGLAVDYAYLNTLVGQRQKLITALVEATGDAVIVTDKWGRISHYNAAARPLFNLNAAPIIGAPLAEAPLQPAVQSELKNAMRHIGSDESTITFEVTLPSEQTLMAVLSRLRYVSPLAAGPLAGAGADSGESWVVVLRDTSHYKAAEAARMEFVEAAAHDMRNPLGVTLSSLVMLQDFIAPDDPMSGEIFQIALDAVNQMQELLDDMVHLEHIANGEGFETQRMAPYLLLLEALAEMEPYITSREQTVMVDAAEDLPPIDVSPVWFRRALTNYLSNASKYTQEGGHIILHARVQDDEFVVEVKDNGPGIPPEAQGRLFERFYRVPASKEKARGTGLGLAIVRSVAEAHDGHVYARSSPEQGSIFGIVLPLAAANDPGEA